MAPSSSGDVLLHHGRGLSCESALMHQVRSIWVPRDFVAPACAVFGALCGSLLLPSARWLHAGPFGVWLSSYSILCCIRRMEELMGGLDEDEVADRRASPPLLGLFGTSAAAAAGWLLAVCASVERGSY